MLNNVRNSGAFIVAVLAMYGGAHAQQLVPNPGFEELLQCPDFQSQLDRTAHWFDPSVGGTPDLFHACGEPLYSVPGNAVGVQDPVNGQAYAGIFLWIQNVLDEWREYLEVPLTAPLNAGTCYHFRMHANLGDFSGFTTDALGVHFAMDSVLTDDPFAPGLEPHISLAPGTFLDRNVWTVVEGEYTAAGGERFLLIGNLNNDAGTTVQPLPPGPPNTGDHIYAFIDSVTVTPCGGIALALPEATASSLRIPSPVPDVLQLPLSAADVRVRVFDSAGRTVHAGAAGEGTVHTAAWRPGVYVVELSGPRGVLLRQRVLKG